MNLDPSELGIINPVLQGPESPSFLLENWWKQLVGHLDYGTCRTGLMTTDLKRKKNGRTIKVSHSKKKNILRLENSSYATTTGGLWFPPSSV